MGSSARKGAAAVLAAGLLAAGGTAGASGAAAADCLSAPVAARYAELGGDGGPLGPVAACERPTARATGSFATFRSGVVYRSAATGAWDVSGSFLGLWRSTGYENGFLGYPTSGETWSNGGVVRQVFQGGDLYWCTRTAAAGPHSLSGAFRGLYDQSGGPYGRLGVPLTQEVPAARGGVRQGFQYGGTWWTPATGAHSVTGSFAGLFQREGAERGRLGYPRTEEVPVRDGGVFQNFDGGVLYWTAATDAHVLRGAVLAAYAATGYENGPLGYPTSDERTVGAGTRTDFQGGHVTWTRTGGATVVLTPAGG